MTCRSALRFLVPIAISALCIPTATIAAGSPDLVPGEVKVTPTSIMPGQTIRVSWTMANKGDGDAKESVTGLRLKAVWAGSLKTGCAGSYITLVREIATDSIEAGRSISAQYDDVPVPADAPSGGYVVVVVADNSKSSTLGQKDVKNDFAQSDEVTLIGQSAISTGRPLMADMELVPEGAFADPRYPLGQKDPKEHVGTDYRAAGGNCVFAVREGEVESNATSTVDPMAAVLTIKHSDGSRAYYGHIESSLGKGSKVARGALLGTVRSHAPGFDSHLHYGEWAQPSDISIKNPETDCENKPWVTKAGNWGWGRVPLGTERWQMLKCGWIDTRDKFAVKGLATSVAQPQAGQDPPTPNSAKNILYPPQKLEETVLFERNGDIWAMDGSGSHQRQITTSGVGYFSASATGMIAYDRFRQFGPPSRLSDLNVYKITIGELSETKLTKDNYSIRPSVSPDGTKIAFQKFEWKGERSYRGRGRGIWIVDTKTGDQRELVGIASLPVTFKQERDKVFRLVGAEGMNEAKWTYDSELTWSADSRSILFKRTYENGGVVTFFVDLTKTDKPQAVPYLHSPCGSDLRGSRILCWEQATYSLITYDFATDRADFLAKDVFVGAAQFSPDGTQIAFEVKTGDHASLSDLYVMSSTGQNTKKITRPSIPQIEDIAWSLDGKRILFERYFPAESRSEIWSVAADGTNLKRLADHARLPHPTSNH